MGLKINLIPCLFMFILCCNDNKCQIYPDERYGKKERQLDWMVRREMANVDTEYRKSEQKRLRDRVISEIEASYSEKVGHKKAKKMWRYNQQITAQFDESKFEKEARMGKKCDEESLKISEYILLKTIPTFGVYHVGVLVCGIEIHYHGSEQGIRYWKPREYVTKSGGTHRGYKTLYTEQGVPVYTDKSLLEIVFIVDILQKYFNIYTFDVLTKNCIHFARALVRQIGDIGLNDTIHWPRTAMPPPKKWYPRHWPDTIIPRKWSLNMRKMRRKLRPKNNRNKF